MLRLAIVGACLIGIAQADTLSASAERFTLQQADGGFLRLDRTTGALSFCTVGETAGLVCRVGADERATFEAKIAALAGELRRAQDALAVQRGTPAAANSADNKPKGFVELLLARMIHAARRGDEPKATPDSRHN